MTAPAAELVVARHTESLNWLRRVPRSIAVTVYDKGPPPGQGLPLPNHGREAHTYLHHLVERYDDLAGITVFSQGHPFDHVPDLHVRLRELAAGRFELDGFRWLGFLIDEDDDTGARLFQTWSKNPTRTPLPLHAFFQQLWGTPAPGTVVFYGGAHFAVTADLVRRQPRSFYERARDLSRSLPEAAHCFERCWDRVFGIAGVPPVYRPGPFPIYLKKVRRREAASQRTEPPRGRVEP